MSVGATKTESRSTSEAKTPRQKKGLITALDLYEPLLGQNANVFQGDRVANLNPLQQTAISGAGNFAQTFSTPTTANVPLFQETGEATQGLLAGTSGAQPLSEQAVSDFFTRTIKDPTLEAFQRETIPGINEAFSGPGFFGSARSQAIQESGQRTQDQLSQQLGGLQFANLQRNQDLQESAAGRTLATLPSAQAFGRVPAENIRDNLRIASEQVEGLSDLIGIGGVSQTQEQAELEAEITTFIEEAQITDPANMAIFMALLGLNFSSASGKGSGSGFNIGLGQAQSS